MLPSITFAQATSLGGPRRFAISLLLPLPALYYLHHLTDPGVANTVAAYMREGGVHAAQALGASGPGALLVAAMMGTFVIPMLGFALAWAAGHLSASQILLAWLGQALINTCQYVHGNAAVPQSLPYSAGLRVPGLEALNLAGVSIAVGAAFFLLGTACFIMALMLPLKYAAECRAPARLTRKVYRLPKW